MKRPLVPVLAISAALLASSCGGGGGEEESAVTVKGVEYAYEMPAEIEGGMVKMNFENAGSEVHEFALARLSGGKTEKDVKEYLDKAGPNTPPPPWASDVGGVTTMSPGAEIGITRNLQPGNYAFVCFLPNPQGVPHYKLGMIKGFKVSGENDAGPPQTDGSITATDKTFEVTKLAAGHQTIELRNDTKGQRAFNLFEQKPGKSLEDLKKWFETGLKGEPPANLLGTMEFIPPGESDYLDVDIKPGVKYVMIDPEHDLQRIFEATE